MRRLISVASIAAILAAAISAYNARADKNADERCQRYIAQRTEEGKEVVRAIYAFKQHNGLWPCSLDELVPDFIAVEKTKEWEFSWHHDAWWLLTDIPGRVNGDAVSYEYRPSHQGWIVTDGISRANAAIEQPKPIPDNLSEAQRTRNRLQVMKRRIEASSRGILHHQGLICWHFRRNEFREARDAAAFCLEKLPDHWWPHLMLSVLDAKLGNEAEAERRMRQWVEAEPGFNRYFLLSHFYATTGKTDKALETLRDACRHPFTSLCGPSDDGNRFGITPLCLPWMAANYALEHKRYDVGIAICDRWEAYRATTDSSADRSYLLIRAACYLSQGKFERAEHDSRLVPEEINVTWAKNAGALKKAISSRDVSFVYKPSSESEAFDLLIEYE